MRGKPCAGTGGGGAFLVLLKNDGDFLPLKQKEKVAFIGPYADRKQMLGGWSFLGDPADTVTVKEAAETLAAGWNFTFSKGCPVLDSEPGW